MGKLVCNQDFLYPPQDGKPWWYGLHGCQRVYSNPKVLLLELTYKQVSLLINTLTLTLTQYPFSIVNVFCKLRL